MTYPERQSSRGGVRWAGRAKRALVLAGATLGLAAIGAAGLAALRAPAAGADQADWTRPMEGLYGDRVGALLFVGDVVQGTRSMLMLSRGAGLYRVRADGSGWDAVNVAPSARRDLVYAIAPKLNDVERRTVYAGLGRPLPLFARSEDYGVTWATVAGPTEPRRFDLLVACTSGRLYAAEADTQQVLWTSIDEGDTWESNQALPAGKPIRALVAAPDEPYVYAIAGTTLYRSNDQPTQWEPIIGPATEEAALVYRVAVASNGRLAVSAEVEGAGRVLSSTDRGQTWPNGGWPAGTSSSPGALCLGEETGLPVLWLGHRNGRCYRSMDGGATWSVEGRFAVGARVIVQDEASSDLWVGSDGLGLYRLLPILAHTGAVPVEALSVVAPASGASGLALLNARILPAERDDLGILWPELFGIFESDDGERWSRRSISTGLGTNLLASPEFASDGRLYSGPMSSSDGGTVWTPLGEAPEGGVPHVLAVGPISGTRPVLYGLEEPYQDGAGGRGLLRSESGGLRWDDTEGPQSGIVAAVVSPDYARDRTAYVATDMGFMYEALDGRNFLQVGRIPTTNPVRSLYALGISPGFSSDRTLVAVVDDPSDPSQHAHVYISTKAGTGLWQDRSQGLAGASHPRSLALSPTFGSDGVAFVGADTDGGLPAVYGSVGDTWFAELATGAAIVNDFAWAGTLSEGRLYAAAGSAGLWIRQLDGPPMPPTTSTPTTTASETPTATPTAGPETATPTASATEATETSTYEPPSATPTVSATPTHPTATATPSGAPSPTASATPGAPIYLPFAVRPRDG